jgi:hypothetical protein
VACKRPKLSRLETRLLSGNTGTSNSNIRLDFITYSFSKELVVPTLAGAGEIWRANEEAVKVRSNSWPVLKLSKYLSHSWKEHPLLTSSSLHPNMVLFIIILL